MGKISEVFSHIKVSKIIEFNIVLHSNRQVFYPGDEISGEVILNLEEPIEMEGLYIECQGIFGTSNGRQGVPLKLLWGSWRGWSLILAFFRSI